jgi:hypothetical protein
MVHKAKTTGTDQSVVTYVDALEIPGQKEDAQSLIELFARISGEKPKMWGPSIIGFGSYDYIYDSGHSGSSLRIGFAARKTGLVIYIVPGFSGLTSELETIGPHMISKSCLNIKNLRKTNMGALETLARKALCIMDARYPRA